MGTEAVKYDNGKPRMDLIPPEAMLALGAVLEVGARKYSFVVENEWHRLLSAVDVEKIKITTPMGCVEVATKNNCEPIILILLKDKDKTEGIGKAATKIACVNWEFVEEAILSAVRGINIQSGLASSGNMGLQSSNMLRCAKKDVQYAAQKNTCTLTIATKLGNLEESFAQDVIMDSVFWATIWRGLKEQFGICAPREQAGARNWEQGFAWGRSDAALKRHLTAWEAGQDNDPETGLPHLWHVLANAAFLVTFEARQIGTDDRAKGCAIDLWAATKLTEQDNG